MDPSHFYVDITFNCSDQLLKKFKNGDIYKFEAFARSCLVCVIIMFLPKLIVSVFRSNSFSFGFDIYRVFSFELGFVWSCNGSFLCFESVVLGGVY